MLLLHQTTDNMDDCVCKTTWWLRLSHLFPDWKKINTVGEADHSEEKEDHSHREQDRGFSVLFFFSQFSGLLKISLTLQAFQMFFLSQRKLFIPFLHLVITLTTSVTVLLLLMFLVVTYMEQQMQIMISDLMRKFT